MLFIYITDGRSQYPPTALTTIGLQRGSVNEYRYRLKWVQPALHDRWSTNSLVGERVLILFLEGNTGAGLVDPRAYCLRTGVVEETFTRDGYATAKVRLEEFCPVRDLSSITHVSDDKNMLRSGPADQVFVLENQVQIAPSTMNSLSSWQDVARELAQTHAFSDASFAYFEGVFPLVPGSSALPVVSGEIRLDPGRSYNLRVHTHLPQAPGVSHAYTLSTDDAVLRLSNGSSLTLRHRSQSFPLMSRTGRTIGGMVTSVTLLPEPGVLGTELMHIVSVRPTRGSRIGSLAFPAVSAATAASAGVLGVDAPLWVKVAMVAAGSIGISIAATRKT